MWPLLKIWSYSGGPYELAPLRYPEKRTDVFLTRDTIERPIRQASDKSFICWVMFHSVSAIFQPYNGERQHNRTPQTNIIAPTKEIRVEHPNIFYSFSIVSHQLWRSQCRAYRTISSSVLLYASNDCSSFLGGSAYLNRLHDLLSDSWVTWPFFVVPQRM